LRLAERLQDEADQRIAQLNAEHAKALQAAREATKGTKFVQANQELARLTSELGAARRETAANRATAPAVERRR
jgi:hypothetical protein